MTTFSDRLLVSFLQDSFVTDLLENQVTLDALLELVISPEGIAVEELALAGIRRREFALPVFETLHSHGTDEMLGTSSERTRIERTEPKRGRLEWVDIRFEVDLAAKVSLTGGTVDSITVRNMVKKLEPFATMLELRARMATLYPQSVVDAYFERFRITSVEQFRREPQLFLEIVSKQPPPFDPNDPSAVRRFRVTVCVQIQSEARVGEALQAAKLSRGVLDGETAFVATNHEYEVTRPHAFLVLFPDASITDATLPGLTAAQTKTGIRNVFRSEGMLAHFV